MCIYLIQFYLGGNLDQLGKRFRYPKKLFLKLSSGPVAK